MVFDVIKYCGLTLSMFLFTSIYGFSQPVMDGSFDGTGVWGSPISVADGVDGWATSNAKNTYMVDDGTYLYLGAEVKASPWKAWAFIINTKSGGGDTDSWARSIDYEHCELPDYDLRGHFDSYAEFHEWSGMAWIKTTLMSTEFGENISSDDQDGWVEVRILKSTIGNPISIDVQFYITGNENYHGSFDACPDDDNVTAWDASGNRSPLNIYNTTSPQVVVAPSLPDDTDDVTISFNAECTPLEGATKVYLHSGVSTNASDPTSFNNTIGNWGQDDGIGQMNSTGSDQWEMVINGMRSKYGVDAEEDIFGLNFLFRNADGTVKEDNGGSNYFNATDPGPYFSITAPEFNPSFQAVSSSVDIISESGIAPTTWTVQELDPVDDSVLSTPATQSGMTTFTHAVNVSNTSLRKFKIIADYGGGVLKFKTQLIQGYNAVTIAPRPGDMEPGIHYNSSSSVTLILHAPTHTIFRDGNGVVTGTNPTTPKQVVYVVGDFNGWTANESSKMIRDTDDDGDTDLGDYWWITLTGLTPGQEYRFQYLIDGHLQVADPYCEKVSDPDDQYISMATYPGLIGYHPMAQDRASVLQTDQPSYPWSATSFIRPTNDRLNVYEIHFRDFTEEGTYLAAIEKLDYIKYLGINAIHVMPISEFEGNSSWGYNPNFYFAPDKAYGPKSDLKKFIDECHKRKIQVFNDLVLNHAFYSNVMARMWWNDVLDRPADDNPFFNPEHKMIADPAGWWGVDWNHESEHVQKMVDRVLDFWLQEYKFDGFRFDFTKGFGQTAQDPADPWASSSDPARVALLNRMVDGMWARNPGSVAIFEHLAVASEDSELGNHGILLWSGVGHHNDVKEFSLGWNGHDIYSSGYYQAGGRTLNNDKANWMSYAESHDEQRLGYEVMNFGDLVKDAIDTTEQQRLMIDRLKIAAGFNLLFPGPRMIWQFQELGYEVDIDFNGRTGEKPVRWWYFDLDKRKELYTLISHIFRLRNDHYLYGNSGSFPDYGNTGNGAAPLSEPRYMKFDIGSGKYAMIVANLDPRNGHNYTAGFPAGGEWYRYNGDPLIDGTTITASGNIPLDSSDVFLLTNFPLIDCNKVTKELDAIIPNTLRASIDCAMSGDTIEFEYPIDGNKIILNTPLIIDKDLVIRAEIDQDIIIDGNQLLGPAIVIPSGVTVELIEIKILCNGNDCLDVSGDLTIKNMELKKSSP